MTDSSPRNRAGRLFASDLRSIREQQGVAIKDILDATRLAEDVIEQFEETALLDNPVFNRVYLRSLVSSYARLIDIDESVALQGLEDTLRGEYEGALGTIYLSDVSPAHETDPDDTEGSAAGDESDEASDIGIAGAIENTDVVDASDEDASEEDAPDEDASEEDAPDEDASEEDAPDEDADTEPQSTDEEASDAPGPDGTGDPTDPARESPDDGSESGDSDDSGNEDDSSSITDVRTESGPGTTVDRPAGKSDSGSSILSPPETGKGLLLPDMRGLVAAIVAGVVLIALVWISVAWFLDNPAEETDQEDAVPAVDSTIAEPEPTPDPVVLPDTFEVHVIARDEPLDPIRSRVDNDLRRPYWVELGDTLTFRASDTVTLEREVDHALVLIESYLPPERWLEPDGQYVITRQRTQAWLDSLVAAGVFPPESPDSLAIPALQEDRSESQGGSGSGGAASDAEETGAVSDAAGTELDLAAATGHPGSENSPDSGRLVPIAPNAPLVAPHAAR